MAKRKYTKIQAIESEIIAKRKSGRSWGEIAEYFGLETEQVANCIRRYNRRKAKILRGEQPRPKGRPRKDSQPPHQTEKTELERLRMENKLLRDFLQFTGRK